MESRTYREALQRASSLLHKTEKNPKIAEWLLLHLLQVDKNQWFEYINKEISLSHWGTFFTWIERVLDGEPYQYITGVEEFYGREFTVSPAVLIPRPETELLVEQVLQYKRKFWSETEQIVGVDVGTGSGAIAISLALECDSLRMMAVDISNEALQVAKDNAFKLQANVEFLPSNLLAALTQAQQKVDVIVSNPPYIPTKQKAELERNVVDFEPHVALFAPEDGLFFYREIIKQAQGILKPKGMLAFEVGLGQAQQVVTLVKEYFPHAQCQVKQDLQGIDRMVFALIDR
jgi:release factor glutamine methyltransferase